MEYRQRIGVKNKEFILYGSVLHAGEKIAGVHPITVRLPGLRKAGIVKVYKKMSIKYRRYSWKLGNVTRNYAGTSVKAFCNNYSLEPGQFIKVKIISTTMAVRLRV